MPVFWSIFLTRTVHDGIVVDNYIHFDSSLDSDAVLHAGDADLKARSTFARREATGDGRWMAMPGTSTGDSELYANIKVQAHDLRVKVQSAQNVLRPGLANFSFWLGHPSHIACGLVSEYVYKLSWICVLPGGSQT